VGFFIHIQQDVSQNVPEPFIKFHREAIDTRRLVVGHTGQSGSDLFCCQWTIQNTSLVVRLSRRETRQKAIDVLWRCSGLFEQSFVV
jgi:hypothetical protein